MHIINYMRANFDHWFEFANTTIGLGLRDEEILFVSGTMKTSRWAVAAFRGESRKAEGSFTANLASFGEATVSMSVSSETPPLRYYRTGPSQQTSVSARPAIQALSSSPTPLLERRDQCIFMNYYRMKRRFWKPMPMQAAGDAHDCSGPSSEDSSEPESHFIVVDESDRLNEERGKAQQVCMLMMITFPSANSLRPPQYVDPVVYVLDYILEVQ